MTAPMIWDWLGRNPRKSAAALIAGGAAIIGGCAGATTGPSAQISPDTTRRIEVDARAAQARVPALINGQGVSWSELQPRLSELAGRAALEELVLDRMLEREMERRGVAITPSDIDRERAAMRTEVSGAGGTDVLSTIRRDRGLGDQGLERLLRRNAMLRALTSGDAIVDEREIDLAVRIRHGDRTLARILVTPSEREASSLREQVLGAGGDRLDAFASRASTHSIDASGARGGRIGPVSPDDPAYPDSVRRALASLAPGQLSNVIALEGGFAVLLSEQQIPSERVGAGRRSAIQRELTLRKQRLAMDRLADRLLSQASVSVMDPSLAWSWESRDRER